MGFQIGNRDDELSARTFGAKANTLRTRVTQNQFLSKWIPHPFANAYEGVIAEKRRADGLYKSYERSAGQTYIILCNDKKLAASRKRGKVHTRNISMYESILRNV